MNNIKRIGIVGLGFVGGAIYESLNNKINELNLQDRYCVVGYDKFKQGGIGSIDNCLHTEILFMALPTIYDTILQTYDNTPLMEWCDILNTNNYDGLIVIKSTILIRTIDVLNNKYNKLKFIHNPEFLTARSAYDDFHNQKHVVIGTSKDNMDISSIIGLYNELYPNANISICKCSESESMKMFCNVFYAVKVQLFNEFYLMTQKSEGNFDKIVELMLKNGWINPMHTKVPGPDGKLSYGGLCFPKDTNALLQLMKKQNSPHSIIEATIKERNEMRDDHDNIK